MHHTFHIPVLGLAFSVDSPIKVAQYGISSVVSIVDDELIENMRKYHAVNFSAPYEPIVKNEEDARARRITSYLNLLNTIVSKQIADLKGSDLRTNPGVQKYFRLLPTGSEGKSIYACLLAEKDENRRSELEERVKSYIIAGAIDVNIMAKVDKLNADKKTKLVDPLFSDASAALRGFANSNLSSSVVLSAGLNPRLYHYLSELPAFLPDENGRINKHVVLKVSDYRSALIQAKYLAKKGIWVSEFRVESGLNCGGHAFATDGYLLGPILEEFKERRNDLQQELTGLYVSALQERGLANPPLKAIKLTVQGGIGTAAEQQFLLDHYQVDGTGWGSPFLLVPEATTLDPVTLDLLAEATADDFYISGASPLGVPFNNFRKSSAEKNRLDRIAQGRPGAPCTKKYLVSNTEFTVEPICTASRKYQSRKIQELTDGQLSKDEFEKAYNAVLEKTCLCEGLATSAYLKYGMHVLKKNTAVSICPGPNLSYFDRVYSLEEMVSHIYGRCDLLKNIERPSMFINELKLYIEYIEKQFQEYVDNMDIKKKKYIDKFLVQIRSGVDYYQELSTKFQAFPAINSESFLTNLLSLKERLQLLVVKV